MGFSNLKIPKLCEFCEKPFVCNFRRGSTITKKQTVAGNIPVIAGGQQPAYYHNEANRNPNTITVSSSGAYSGFVGFHSYPIFASDCFTIEPKNEEEVNIKFLFHLLKARQEQIYDFQEGGGQPHVYPKHFEDIEIPLPPLEIQIEIVAEIEGYQKIIDGAKQVVENYKPTIKINPDWEMVELGKVFNTSSGGTPLREINEYYENGNIPWIKSGEVARGNIYKSEEYITIKGLENSSAKIFPIDTVLIAMYGATAGQVGILKIESATNQAVCGIYPNENYLSQFLYYFLKGKTVDFLSLASGGGQQNISQNIIKKFEIPICPIEEQQQIVSQIEEEQKLVNANKKLIEIFEQKIKDRIDEVWGVKK